ncbi:MAG: hypothetical protein LH614_22210 [Pyrinomonadaceae bacterium]|nr:hypothetical protein [Pyrinomonadaceae bacterium]
MVLDTGQYASGYLQIAVDEHPEAVVFKQRVRSSVKVSVCGDCGYLEFYAEQPGLMYRAYQNMLNNE